MHTEDQLSGRRLINEAHPHPHKESIDQVRFEQKEAYTACIEILLINSFVKIIYIYIVCVSNHDKIKTTTLIKLSGNGVEKTNIMSQSIISKNEDTAVGDDPIIETSSTITATMPTSSQHNIVSNNTSPIQEKTDTAPLSPETIASVTSSFHQSLPNMNAVVNSDNSIGNNSFSPTTSISNDIRALSFSPSSLQSIIVPSISTSPTATTTTNQQPTNDNIQSTTTMTTNGTTTLQDDSTTSSLQQIIPSRDAEHGPVGCYMVFETSSGGRLMLYYSMGPVPENSVGFWCPGSDKIIQGFKFKQTQGRSELIKGIAGGDSNRRKYFVGWCQFCKLAKSYHGKIIQFKPRYQGVDVDIYGYNKTDSQPTLLNLDVELIDISMYDAVAVMPKHHEFLKGVKSIPMTQFLELGNLAGATTMMN